MRSPPVADARSARASEALDCFVPVFGNSSCSYAGSGVVVAGSTSTGLAGVGVTVAT